MQTKSPNDDDIIFIFNAATEKLRFGNKIWKEFIFISNKEDIW